MIRSYMGFVVEYTVEVDLVTVMVSLAGLVVKFVKCVEGGRTAKTTEVV